MRGLSLHIILRPFLFLLFCGLFPLYLSAQHTESVTGKDTVGRLIEPPEPIEQIFLNVDLSFVGTLNQQYTPSTGDTLSYNITYNDLHIIKDHLDSPRKIFTNLTVRERNYYYPFGLRTDQRRAYPTLSDRYTVKVPRLTQSTGGTTTQIGYRSTAPYTLQYNGKELQLLANTTLIDYGARQYNPTLARWTAQDPMAEKYYNISPYAYCAGNPISLVDEKGEVSIDYNTDLYNIAGKKIGTDGVDNGVKMVVLDKKEARQISNTKGNIDLSSIKSGVVLPSDIALRESLNVLDRTIANGGLREESSIIMNDGVIIRGETGPMPTIVNGVQIATSNLPQLPTGATASDVEAIIHSHPTEVQQIGNKIFAQSARMPSKVDKATFSKFNTNIIVGPLGSINNVMSNYYGTSNIPNRPNGAVIYNKNAVPLLELTRQAIQNILKK